MAIIIPGIISGTGTTGPVQTLTETVKNTSGGTLLKGTPVRITGATGQEANVGPADASTAFPANFVLAETLAPGESGQAVALGFINNVSVPDASLFTAGQEVYLGAGGGWTTTRPTGAANIQLLGNIVKVNTGANTISGIFAPQNIEYLPNLTQGKIWVGNASGLPEESDPAFSPAFSGQIINGVAHFVEITAPSFRKNAAGQNIGALVAGDKWYKPTDNGTPGTAGDWIWTGSDWVSTNLQKASVGHSVITTSTTSANLTGTGANFAFPETGKIFVTHADFAVRPSGVGISSGNDFAARMALYQWSSVFYNLISPFSCFSAGYTVNDTTYRQTITHNAVLDFSTASSVPVLNINVTETGSAQASFYGAFYYRWVHP